MSEPFNIKIVWCIKLFSNLSILKIKTTLVLFFFFLSTLFLNMFSLVSKCSLYPLYFWLYPFAFDFPCCLNVATKQFCFSLLQNGTYKSIHAMAKDIDLLAKNAKTYNEPGSQVFKVSFCHSCLDQSLVFLYCFLCLLICEQILSIRP